MAGMRVRVRLHLKLRGIFRKTFWRRSVLSVSEWMACRADAVKRRIMRDACDREIFSSCLLLKNLSVMKQDAPLSADYMLEQLKDSSFLLRRIYEDMIRDYRNGQYEEAFSRMPEKVGTRAAVLFSHILSKIDQVNPAQLAGYMRSFEESFQEARVTQAVRRNQRKALVCTAVSMAAVLAVLMNFTAVAVFMNMHEMLNSISMF